MERAHDSSDKNAAGQASASFAYDEVAYAGNAEEFIHPRNLEVTASLFGLNPAPLGKCRILELGCADGTNLLPLAMEFPESKFVGVDLAGDRIREARELADEVGLTNIEFHHIGVRDVDSSLGTFDYLHCPGIFSWVKDDERLSMLRACRECLAPEGMAAISYNTYPGWNWNGALRDLIRRHVRAFEDPASQIAEARKAIEFIAAQTSTATPHGMFYASARELLRHKRDAYLYHDYITDQNQPFYFHEFTGMLANHDLEFVTEADFRHSSGFGLEPSARAELSQAPPQEREQYLDFLLNTGYRRSIVCRTDCQRQHVVQTQLLGTFHFALIDPFEGPSLPSQGAKQITLPVPNGSITVTDPIGVAVIEILREQWPLTFNLEAIYKQVVQRLGAATDGPSPAVSGDGLARTLLTFYGAGLIRVFKSVPKLSSEISDRPQVTPLVRAAAARSRAIVNQWHQNVHNPSLIDRYLLSRLDGTRDHRQLQEEVDQFRSTQQAVLAGSPAATKPSAIESSSEITELLAQLRHKRLLVA